MSDSLPGQQTLPGMQPTPAPPESIMNLLRDFHKTPGCEKYKGDSQKINMLTLYLWLRQMTDGLTFERFLEKFSKLADYDETNRKAPDDAIAFHCPRSAKAAEAAGKPQWSADEVVGILALYIGMIRYAEGLGEEISITLDQYLAMDAPGVKAGTVVLPKADSLRTPRGEGGNPPAKRRAQNSAPSQVEPVTGLPPTGVGIQPHVGMQLPARVVYQMHRNGRQMYGSLLRAFAEADRQYGDFRSDNGELFEGCNLQHFLLLDQPAAPQRNDIFATGKLNIPKAEFPMLRDMLALTSPVGNHQLGDVIKRYSYEFPLDQTQSDVQYLVDLNILNGETGAYVDAQLINKVTDDVISDVPPRQNLLGDYTFDVPGRGAIQLEVTTRE